ncbi:hypothetical protein DJ010_10210 [Nocardioides silvaticus]|uniref:Uncharacterized protein n=1 Tax=Nocardioides silvaticus TaxID=2201891 RepID=A0A316TE90_9ACTN|nr:hypothetical protein [Nocardioides silvaticus]PWN02783.1 hypothetical protein DJ010_10210 [Nocardioides silvaticus]
MTRGLRRVTAAGVAAALLAAMSGCGEDDDPYAVPDRFEDYCEEVAEQQTAIGQALESGGEATGLIRALPSFEALAEKAPDDIADDWEVVVERIDVLVGALEDAGVDPESYNRRKPPTGLDREQRDAIDAAAVALVSTTTAQAMSSVQQQARDVCKTPLLM